MASFNGANYAKSIAVPAVKTAPGEVNGRVKVLHERYTCTQNVYAINDTIQLPSLPAGAKVLNAVVDCASLGTTGIIDLGWAASTDLSGSVVAADANGLISGADAGGAAVHKAMSTEAGFMQDFGQETSLVAIFTEATDAANGVVIDFIVEYVLD